MQQEIVEASTNSDPEVVEERPSSKFRAHGTLNGLHPVDAVDHTKDAVDHRKGALRHEKALTERIQRP